MAKHIAGLQRKAAVLAVDDNAEGMLAPLIGKYEASSVSSDESSLYSSDSTISIKVKQTASEMIKTAVGKFNCNRY